MYDYLCTDFRRDDADYQALIPYAEHVLLYREKQPEGPSSRHLLISHNQSSREDAIRRGLGVLQWQGPLSESLVEPLLATYDQRPPQDCKLFLFDLGNVVVTNIEMLNRMADIIGLDPEVFAADYLHYEFPLMDGSIAEAEYWNHVEHQFGIAVPNNPFATAFKPVMNKPIVKLIKTLRKKGYRVVCASNTIDSHWKHLKKMGVLDLFDATYASHLLGISKPAAAFYETILDKEGIPVSQSYFIDDREDNVEASRKLGIASLLYADSVVKTRDERLKILL